MTTSKQPRVSQEKARLSFLHSIIRWVDQANLQAPTYGVGSQRMRDEWLRWFWRQEPHLAGVLKSVVDIDKNRGWQIVGGRNQVNLYSRILRNADPYINSFSDNGVPLAGKGWRYYFSQQSLSFYTADVGAVSEMGRDIEGGPLRALWHTDPTRCELTSGSYQSLNYYPPEGGKQEWTNDDYIREVSMPSTDETLYGLGYCAVSRILETATIMIAVYRHEQERLMAKIPKGIMLMRGITDSMWEDAMDTHAERLTAKEREYYAGLSILFGDEAMDAKLVALSNLPEGFDLKITTDLLMFTYALNFGYDASEFWPVQFGSLGRGTEAEVQALKASGKGGLDFVLNYQDNLQRQLPETLHFEFEQRNEQGEILEAEVAESWARAINEMAKPSSNDFPPTLTNSEKRQLLAQRGLIPNEWTIEEEDHVATDTEDEERHLDNERVQRAIATFPNEDIVALHYKPMLNVWTQKKIWPTNKRIFGVDYDLAIDWAESNLSRQIEEDAVLYKNDTLDFRITTDDVDNAIEQARERVSNDFADVLEAEVIE